MKFKILYFLVFFLGVSPVTIAQTLPPHFIPWQENKNITWSDFQANPDPANKYFALTNSGLSYGYHSTTRDGKLTLNFTVFSYFDKSESWGKVGKQTPELLAHEQLHFDITELHARKLKKVFDNFPFTKNYKIEIDGLTNTILQASHNMQAKYDTETDHSVNKEKQKAWETLIATELIKLNKTTAPAPTPDRK